MDDKKAFREFFLKKRASLSKLYISKREQLVTEQVIELIKKENVSVVHTYVPIGSEFSTWSIIKKLWELQKIIIIPKTLSGRILQHYEFFPEDELLKGKYETVYPSSGKVYRGQIDLILIPGAVFDHENNRIGYGAGYYDTFLAEYPNALKIGLAFPCQISETTLPTDSHDIKMDKVIY